MLYFEDYLEKMLYYLSSMKKNYNIVTYFFLLSPLNYVLKGIFA